MPLILFSNVLNNNILEKKADYNYFKSLDLKFNS